MFAFLFLLAGCKEKKEEKKTRPPTPVQTEKARSKTVPYVVKTIGNTKTITAIDVRPQVSGELTEMYFIDGQYIEKGDLLFTIDKRPYEAALEEAQGQYDEAKAALTYYEDRVRRYRELLPDDFVSVLDFEKYVSNVEEAKGRLTQYDGAVKSAEVNLGYCTIYAPAAGKCGEHQIDPGNILTANQDKVLVTINQIAPIYAMMTIPERFFSEVKKYQLASEKGLDVEIEVVGEEGKKYRGKLDFLNNEVDKNTGTALVRAIFENENKDLWPGQFLQAQIELYLISNAVVISEKAIRRDTQGPFVFIAKEDGNVEQRKVVLGQLLGKEQVIQKGVNAGEMVVTEGQLNLAPGSKYIVKNENADKKMKEGGTS